MHHTKDLSQGTCTWSSASGFSSRPCDNGTAKCGSAAEKTANAGQTAEGAVKSCDDTKDLSQGTCTWTSSGGFSSDACDNGTAKCGSQAEKDANANATGTKRSCDHTKALSQGTCTWSSSAGFSSDACDNGTAKCGSQAEKDANRDATGTKRS